MQNCVLKGISQSLRSYHDVLIAAFVSCDCPPLYPLILQRGCKTTGDSSFMGNSASYFHGSVERQLGNTSYHTYIFNSKNFCVFNAIFYISKFLLFLLQALTTYSPHALEGLFLKCYIYTHTFM